MKSINYTLTLGKNYVKIYPQLNQKKKLLSTVPSDLSVVMLILNKK